LEQGKRRAKRPTPKDRRAFLKETRGVHAVHRTYARGEHSRARGAERSGTLIQKEIDAAWGECQRRIMRISIQEGGAPKLERLRQKVLANE